MLTLAAFTQISISMFDGFGELTGYSVNSTGLHVEDRYGWLACDWWYKSPQIFSIAYRDAAIPTSCSRVNLIAEPVA